MISRFDNENLKKSNGMNMENPLQKDEEKLQSNAMGMQQEILLQDPVAMNQELKINTRDSRQEIFEKYSKACSDYNALNKKKDNEGDISKVEEGINFDKAEEFLGSFQEPDISTDEALIENYALLKDAEKMLKKMQSIPAFMGSSFLDANLKNRYERLCLITEYANARFACIDNNLFANLKSKDLEFVENSETIEDLIQSGFLREHDMLISSEKDLKEFFDSLKKARSLKKQLNDKKNIVADQNEGDDELLQVIPEELNDSFFVNDDEIFEDKALLKELDNPEKEKERIAGTFEQVRLMNDCNYVRKNFAYSALMNHKRKNNKADGAEMELVKGWLKTLYQFSTTALRTPSQMNAIYDELIKSLNSYVESHDVFYKAVSDEGKERLGLVKEALTRAQMEKAQLYRLYPYLQYNNTENLLEKEDSPNIYAKISMGIDMALAVKKKVTEECQDENKKKDKIGLFAGLFYQADKLAKLDGGRYMLMDVNGGTVSELFDTFADDEMLRKFYGEKDKLLRRLAVRYNTCKRHAVPMVFLQDKNADPRSEELRSNYALLRVMHDDTFRQLLGMNIIEEKLRRRDGQRLQALKTRRENAYNNDEKSLIDKGAGLFNRLNNFAKLDLADFAGNFPGLDAGEVAFVRFEERNEVKKAMKDYGLSAEQTGEETTNELKEEFVVLNPQFSDVQIADLNKDRVFEEEVKIKKGEERTDRRLAQSGIAPGSTMKKRALLTGVMANFLGMGELVSQDIYGEKQEGDKKIRGIYKEAPMDKALVYHPYGEMSSNVKAQMAKLVFLNMICGQMNLDSAMLTAVDGKYENGSMKYIIEKIRLDNYTEYSFGNLKGEQILEAYKNGRHAELLGKLDDETKEAIRNLTPIFLEQNFGEFLTKEEMEALKDRVAVVQRFLDAAPVPKNKDKDVYEPDREFITKDEEMSFEKVKDYLALPESQKTKRRAINYRDMNIDSISSKHSREFMKKYKDRLQKETGLSEDQLKNIFHGGIHHGRIRVTSNLDGNRFGNTLYYLGTQDNLNDEDYYQIMKGLFAEPLSQYTHETKETVKQEFDLAIEKVKDLAVDRFGRFIEKYGDLAALLNPDDLLVVMNSFECRAAVIMSQDINQLIDEVTDGTKKGSLFDINNPRDAKLLEMRNYINALLELYLIYQTDAGLYNQDQNIEFEPYDESVEYLPGIIEKSTKIETGVYRKAAMKMIGVARKLGKGPSMSLEEYDAYIVDCERRFKERPLALRYLEVQKELFAGHNFVKKEKPIPEDNSDYVARVEELRKQKNTSVTVEGLKMRDKYLKADTDKRREVNEFLLEHNIDRKDFEKVFDARSPRMFLLSYERDENGRPANELARKIHEQNRDFLTALFTGDRLRLRIHINRLISRFLRYDISVEQLKDKNWILRHPETFEYINMGGYLADCMESNEEFAWYFEELVPDTLALIRAKCKYIGTFGGILQSSYLNPVLGFKTSSTDMEIYMGDTAEATCMTEEAGRTALQDALTEDEVDKKQNNEEYVYTDYEVILTQRDDYAQRQAAITRYADDYRNIRSGRTQSTTNKLAEMDAFYKKYAKNFADKKAFKSSSGSVVRLLKEKINENSSIEQTGEILTQNFSELVKSSPAGKEDVKIRSIRSSMKDVSARGNARINMLVDDEQKRAQFKEIIALLPDELKQRAKGQFDRFYSFFLSNAVLLEKNIVAGNLEFVIRNYFGDEGGRKIALDVITQDILTYALDKTNFDEKKLQGSSGLVMARMAKDYNEMLRQSPDYVKYLKSTTDPATGKTYARIVGEALDIIRACGSYARIYNTLSKDPAYASSNAGFLAAPVSAYDSYHIKRAKATISTLDEMADKIQRGEYLKAEIDNFDLIDEEEKRVDGICAKFNEPVGKEYEAMSDISRGLREKTDAIEDPQKKVMELTRLLSSLSAMQDNFGWEEDEVVTSVIKEIIGESPKELKKAAVLLRDKLYKELEADYQRFLNQDVPDFLVDIGYTGDKQLQKKNAAILMLTTTIPYRRIKGLEKLLAVMELSPYEGENGALYYMAEMSFAGAFEPEGLSKEGVFELRDHVKRINLRGAKAFLSKYTSSDNVGFMERNPITQEEIQEWFKNVPKQEDKAVKAPIVQVDPKLLSAANEILPGIQKEYSKKITAEHVVILEGYKKQTKEVSQVVNGYKRKWLKNPDKEYGIDGRDYAFYQVENDGESLEVLFEEEPEIREIYLDSYIRTLMNFEVSPDNLSIEWLLSHLNEFNYFINMGTYIQNMVKDNPDYFKRMSGEFYELLRVKALMIGFCSTLIGFVHSLQDMSIPKKSYSKSEDSSDSPSFVEQMTGTFAFTKNAYMKERQHMLWLCRNKVIENVKGIEKYRKLCSEINSVAYSIKRLSINDYKKPQEADPDVIVDKEQMKEFARNISDGNKTSHNLIEEAQKIIPKELEKDLQEKDYRILYSMYPYILSKFSKPKIAEEEFIKLCLRLAGKEENPSEEEAAQQRKAALDSIAEYILLFSIDDPSIIETDEDLADNSETLERLSLAVEAMRIAMNDNKNSAWMEEKSSKFIASGKTEGEILSEHMTVLEELIKDYKARKAVIIANSQ